MKIGEKVRLFQILRLGTPIVITGYSTVLMLVTDALMVGHLGTEELAAVTPAGLIISLLLILGSETLTTVNTFASTAIGMRRGNDAGNFAWQGIYLSVAFGLIALAYAPTARFVFEVLLPKTEPKILELEVLYFKISLLSVLPITLSSALSNYFVAAEMPRIPMISSLGGVGLNACLNGALIFGFGPIPALGFAGAAWGTACATSLQALFLLTCFLRIRKLRALGSLNAKISKQRMRQMLRVGIPSGVQGCLDLLSWGVLLSWLVGHFGYKHLAAQTILITCIRFSFVPAEGIANALTTLVGRAQGERKFMESQRLASTSFKVIALYMSAMAVVYYLARYQIIGLFTDDVDVISIGANCMVYVAAFQYFDAMNVTYINALQGAGDTAWPTAMQIILTACILLGGGLLMITHYPQWESAGVWLVAALYVAAQGVVFRLRWAGGRWRMIQLLR